jgi:hypothetical protein
MKISLATHGGQIAAIQRGRPPRVLDADALTQAQKAEVARLIAAAEREARSSTAKEPRGADLMSYVIRVEGENAPVELRQSDSAMSPAFAALLDWLHDHLPAK